MRARRDVEKTRGGKVKKRLSHPAWKSRKPPRDSHFPTASTTAGDYLKTGYFTDYEKRSFLMS